MIKKSIHTILLIGNIVLFSACGSNNSDTTSVETPPIANSTNEETILNAAVKIDDLNIKVHTTTFDLTNKYYADFTKISQAHADRMNAEMQLLNTLAKPFDIAATYTSYFSKNSDYNATTPAIIINKTLTNNYFLLSSSSHFYTEGQTVKTVFKDAESLSSAWSRAIANADKTKNLYLSLVEIDSDAKVTNVTNSLLIKSETLSYY